MFKPSWPRRGLQIAILVLLGAAIHSVAAAMPARGHVRVDSPAPYAEVGAARGDDKSMSLWYDAPATDSDDGWVSQSLPLGNGYFGVSVFGGVSRERFQITENSLVDAPTDGIGGLNSFADLYLEFPHHAPLNYVRDLDLDTATAHVAYENAGVRYRREYFTSYPDRVLVVRLTASEPGSLDFTLRPTIPHLAAYRKAPDDRRGKHGTVSADGDVVTLRGGMDYYGIQFEGQFKVVPQGGTLTSKNTSDAGGSISVHGADSAVILVALGTNYRLEPQVFSESQPLDKLKGFPDPHPDVTARLAAASARTFDDLEARHLADYRALYGRVEFDLGETVPSVATDQLVAAARRGEATSYLDEVAFQFGRYLLISSSRAGALPPNLQGVWNTYQDPPWTAGYWHNVNQQMNYWPAFVANLPELFDPYVAFYDAYLPAHRQRATQYLSEYHPAGLAPDGDNGWALGNSMRPFEPSDKAAHSGFGTGPWTAMLFWDRYDFTRDKTILQDVVYPAMRGQANFLSRFLSDVDGQLVAVPSSSPENANSLQSAGTTFDQQMIYEHYRDTLAAARILEVSDDPLLATLREQMPRLDPIRIGESGQIKEYQEETTYGSIGDPKHRHISQLLGVYPGRLVTRETPAWQDAARVSLEGRGSVGGTGWAQAERMETWARLGDGDEAYAFYRYWMSHHAMTNLWNNHRDSLTTKLFQVDGNFGVTAGVGEMLLQSDGVVVAPLAALPHAWPVGSYRGLLARGAFEVSAEWSNGRADRFQIRSKAGGALALRYPGLAGAAVETADGHPVMYRALGQGDIVFNTRAGETYVVTEIPALVEGPVVEQVSVAVDAATAVKLTWRAGPEAVSYAVERAIDDDPGYQRIASGIRQPSYVDLSPAVTSAKRLRYRIIASDSAGVEGPGSVVFQERPASSDFRYLRIDDDLLAYSSGEGTLPLTAVAADRYRAALTWKGGNLTEITLSSGASGAVRMRSPMFDRPVSVRDQAGADVPATLSDGLLSFAVQTGATYRIASSILIDADIADGLKLASGRVAVDVSVTAVDVDVRPSTISLQLPAGWRAEPATLDLPAMSEGHAAKGRFNVYAPSDVADGSYPLTTLVRTDS